MKFGIFYELQLPRQGDHHQQQSDDDCRGEGLAGSQGDRDRPCPAGDDDQCQGDQEQEQASPAHAR